jgi:hypothetical protein
MVAAMKGFNSKWPLGGYLKGGLFSGVKETAATSARARGRRHA